jgi:hypothetical protein
MKPESSSATGRESVAMTAADRDPPCWKRLLTSPVPPRSAAGPTSFGQAYQETRHPSEAPPGLYYEAIVHDDRCRTGNVGGPAGYATGSPAGDRGGNPTRDVGTRPTRDRVVHGKQYDAAAAARLPRRAGKSPPVRAPIPSDGVGELMVPQVTGGQPDLPVAVLPRRWGHRADRRSGSCVTDSPRPPAHAAVPAPAGTAGRCRWRSPAPVDGAAEHVEQKVRGHVDVGAPSTPGWRRTP